MSRSLGSIAGTRHGVAIGGIMAEALVKSGVVDPRVAKKSRALRDVREWLARLQGGALVKVREMSGALSSDERGEVAQRLRLAGFLHYRLQGGATAGDDLRHVRLAEVTDEQLAAVIWGAARTPAVLGAMLGAGEAPRTPYKPTPDEEAEEAEESEPPQVLPSPAGRERPAPPAWGPVPRTKTARDAAFVQHVRAWLGRIAAGEYVPISHLSNVLSGPACSQHGGRLCAAGLVDRSSGVYLATTLTHEAAADWSDERLAAVLWPGRADDSPAEPPPKEDGPADEEIAEGMAAWAGAMSADLADESAPAAPPEDPLAAMLGQFLTILTRMDACFARLERELGLPPLEDDPKAKPVAP